MKLRIQPDAVDDAAAAAEWYEARRPGLGVEFTLELDAAMERASDAPAGYELRYRSVRRVLMRRFPYAVYFLVKQDVVEIVAVLHQHRDPSAWRSRA